MKNPRREVAACRGHVREGHRLPNLFVYIDLRAGQPTGPSLFALSEARRVSRHAGVSILAVVMTAPRPSEQLAPLVARLGLAGADKVLICEAAGLDGPVLDVTHGPALHDVTERLPPIIVLFPAGGPGPELGPSLAARMGGAFAGCSDLEVSEESRTTGGVGRVCLRRWRRDRASYRSLDPVEIERPVVAILGAHGVATEIGTANVEVEVLPCAVPANVQVTVLHEEPDQLDALTLARGLVIVGAEVDPGVVGQLASDAPAGVVVTTVTAAHRATLARSSPQFVMQIGTSVPVGGSPRTRVGRIVLGGDETGDGGGVPGTDAAVDVVWRPEGQRLDAHLVTALGQALAASAGGRSSP